ncbi:MAG: DUF1579 family protein [Planctomycetota bacterium]
MKTGSMILAVLALVGAFALGNAFAQTDDQAPPMPEWMKQTEEHKELQAGCGEFTVKGEWFAAPGAPANTMEGTATRKSILNGFFVEETFKADWMGMKFEGRSIMGYDTIGKQYQGIWTDNVSPYMAFMIGKQKGEEVHTTYESPDPMTSKMLKQRSVLKGDKDHYVLTFFVVDGEKEFMNMRLTYDRKK